MKHREEGLCLAFDVFLFFLGAGGPLAFVVSLVALMACACLTLGLLVRGSVSAMLWIASGTDPGAKTNKSTTITWFLASFGIARTTLKKKSFEISTSEIQQREQFLLLLSCGSCSQKPL